MGTIRVTKAFSPLLRRCKTSPRLVNMTSLAARISLPGKYCQWCFSLPLFLVQQVALDVVATAVVISSLIATTVFFSFFQERPLSKKRWVYYSSSCPLIIGCHKVLYQPSGQSLKRVDHTNNTVRRNWLVLMTYLC